MTSALDIEVEIIRMEREAEANRKALLDMAVFRLVLEPSIRYTV